MARPFGYVLTSEDTGMEHVGIDPMSLTSLLKFAFKYAPRRASSGMSTFAAAIGSSRSRRVFLGVSVELVGLPLHHSINAEQFLLVNLALNAETELTHLALSPDGYNFEAPCGYRGQFPHEASSSSIQILIAKGEIARFETLHNNLLPRNSFFHPFLLNPPVNNLTLLHSESVGKTCEDLEGCNHLNCWALAAANRSAFTNSPAGVALLDKEGCVYRGWSIERVDCGLSLGPVQTALVDFVSNGGSEFSTIIQAVLVEKKDALVSQEDTTRMILKKITNGNCVTNVFHCDLDTELL